MNSLPLHELLNDVDGHGEDDGGVVLGRYRAQGLQVPQLEIRTALRSIILLRAGRNLPLLSLDWAQWAGKDLLFHISWAGGDPLDLS
jgi:hypothetical protein